MKMSTPVFYVYVFEEDNDSCLASFIVRFSDIICSHYFTFLTIVGRTYICFVSVFLETHALIFQTTKRRAVKSIPEV